MSLNPKIKTTHHVLKNFHTMLNAIASLPQIQRIIPGMITNTTSSRHLKGNKKAQITISYPTTSGLKCLMKYGSTTQELFIISNPLDFESINTFINEL